MASREIIMPELKLYTIAQLREWLEHNKIADGLSEQVIAPVRAWAIIHNPYVKDEDSVVAVVFVNGEVAAYTSAFPEEINGKHIWWFSTLWCAPQYRGNGYGLIVIGSLVEIYGAENCFDRWGAPETIEIFSYFNHHTVNTPRFYLGSKINRSTIKGKLLVKWRTMQKNLHMLFERPLVREMYMLQYITHIDDATYSFITHHQANNYILHTQAFINWVLQYSFSISAPLIEYIPYAQTFARAEILSTRMYAVQVYDKEALIGFYLLKHNENILHVLYLYYDKMYKNMVFASIQDHVQKMHIEQCITEDKNLADYLQKQLYFPKVRTAEISFSVPKSMPLPQEGNVQYGDGDCFVV